VIRQASASFLKKRSKKLLVAGGVAAGWGNARTGWSFQLAIANPRESGGKQSIFSRRGTKDGLLPPAFAGVRNDVLRRPVRTRVAPGGGRAPSKQKFFGSFFQKRTSCLTFFGARSWT
jgi:hypothetical protein